MGRLRLRSKHRVLCGDSTNADDVARLMDGEKADVLFTDPPYGVNYIKKSDGSSIRNDGDEFARVVSDAISLVDVSTAYICGDAKNAMSFLQATSSLGGPKSCIVWIKPIQHRLHRYEPCHELVWYWGDNSHPFYGPNVFEATREIERFHPTVKPVGLVKYCLGSHKDTGKVLDLFLGSGTTLIACEQLNRTCYGMEIDPAYCDVIVQRWENLTGKEAVRWAG